MVLEILLGLLALIVAAFLLLPVILWIFRLRVLSVETTPGSIGSVVIKYTWGYKIMLTPGQGDGSIVMVVYQKSKKLYDGSLNEFKQRWTFTDDGPRVRKIMNKADQCRYLMRMTDYQRTQIHKLYIP